MAGRDRDQDGRGGGQKPETDGGGEAGPSLAPFTDDLLFNVQAAAAADGSAAVTSDAMDGPAPRAPLPPAPSVPGQSGTGTRRTRRRPAPVFAPFEWLIAWRYLRAKRKENFASIITVISFMGIMLGVAALITVMAVMNGFRSDLMDRILGVSGHAYVQASYGPLKDYDAIAADIRGVAGVTRAVPVVEGGVMAMRGGLFNYALVRGLRQEDLRSQPLVSENIIAGSLADFEGGRAIAIGSRAAANFGVGVGDRITLVAPGGAATPFGTAPRQKGYRIVAIFEVGMSQFDESFIFMPLEQAQLYFNKGDGITKIDIMVERPDDVKRYRLPILEAGGSGIRVVDWQQVNATLFGALQVERNVMFIIMGLIIIVAALNIISGLVMLVKDKGRDIAVLRTMGATSGSVLRIFLIAGASVGVVGTLAGFGLGLLLCTYIEPIRQFLSYVLQSELFPPDIYFLNKMVAEINNGEVTAVLIFALALSLLAPLYPAWRAARLDPVDALRYE
ncbi:MAG: lipoprotein-releasing ABC transporter permease subunit [Alphaproteobacteria bacterium]